jgi:hypothetical protein
MSSKKRGLGRGLEALLVDVPVRDDREDAADAVTSVQEVERLKAQLSTTPRKQEASSQESNAQSGEALPATARMQEVYPQGHKEQRRELPESKQAPAAAEGQQAPVAADFKTIQRESDQLLEEAESLISLLDEFELMVRRLEID